ncbi:FadR family transcriptional regulator [Nakamurella silvestris]|nr:FadR family transcriptional regulator [Nakamurella silvestris]
MLGIFDESARQLLEVVDLREAFEPAVAGRAAERATPADLARLTEILAASHPDLSPEESASLDREFHLQIAVASQNSLLVSLANVTADWLQDVRTESHQTRTGRAESCAGHREILDAISKRDADRAHLAMAEHVLGIGRLVKDRRSGTGKP